MEGREIREGRRGREWKVERSEKDGEEENGR